MRNKKISFRIMISMLCILPMTSMVALADNSEILSGAGPFEFSLYRGGDKKDSKPVRKTDNYNYARLEFQEFNNFDDLPLLYRLRSYTNDTTATGLYTVSTVCTQRPVYNSGYGLNGYAYYIRIQTDSMSTYSARTTGYWVP